VTDPPATLKCEECDWWSNEVNSDRRAHVKALHTQIAALITENAKLRGLVQEALYGLIMIDAEPERRWRARALLASEDKHE